MLKISFWFLSNFTYQKFLFAIVNVDAKAWERPAPASKNILLEFGEIVGSYEELVAKA